MSGSRGTHNFNGFISFEGIEGSGKSTQAKLAADYLKGKGRDVLITEEPGGTKISRKIRGILLDAGNNMDPLTELLLYNSARAQHVREIIYPALTRGIIVITDRFSDSTLAYQGYARGIDLAVIKTLDDIVAPDLKPSLTFLLDMDVEEGLRRNRAAKKEDRFELETVEFHKKVRNGYHQIAVEEPDRIKIIDASASVGDVSKKIIEILESQWL
ncbi:MAG TPA: dTMP kinase [Nitrospirae bacterium]|nr:thymidylate kinase [bacterium BMS3Abin10]GBE37701.1 thymidylate kinase [bacterium BMS3Bbin08]HDH49818.1 dTMP kinase [Nitrospirota bacterium]HDK41430.1 dTMP kinase [Nitrospirota bacterium]HDK82622.1 dTMP kinase [Nitrospirota bacterium]